MISYKLEPIEDSIFYNITFFKEVKRRSGDTDIDVENRIYSTHFNNAINLIIHKKTQDDFGDKDVSLKEYLSSFYKNWNIIYNENC